MTRAQIIASLRHLRHCLSLGSRLDVEDLALFDQCVRSLELAERGGAYVLETATETERLVVDLEAVSDKLPKHVRRHLIKHLVQLEAADLELAELATRDRAKH